jgi:hypothetical protein
MQRPDPHHQTAVAVVEVVAVAVVLYVMLN